MLHGFSDSVSQKSESTRKGASWPYSNVIFDYLNYLLQSYLYSSVLPLHFREINKILETNCKAQLKEKLKLFEVESSLRTELRITENDFRYLRFTKYKAPIYQSSLLDTTLKFGLNG